MAKQYIPIECQASIAWFKLSELVMRGERERAFSIYRLLAHALEDEAYSAQLKGDLWYAFNEYDRAREAYYIAITGYDFSERFSQSAFLHERLIAIEPQSLTLRIAIITRFAELASLKKVTSYMLELLSLAQEQNQREACISSLEDASCSPAAHIIIKNALYSLRHAPMPAHQEAHLML